jgi:hypothetical protein
MNKHDPIQYTSDFIEYILGLPLAYGDLIFRGQPISGNLIPAVGRVKRKANKSADERGMLRQLFLLGAQYIPREILDTSRKGHQLELMVLAQHFGLQTRLLDWSSNPLIALWFACSDMEAETDVYFYCLESSGLIDRDIYENDPFDIEEICVVEPRLNNQRILAQQGLFTIHPCLSTGFMALDEDKSIARGLHEILIPRESRKQILDDLSRLGVNERTVMPDLTGLCRHLNWQQCQ